MIVIGTSWTLTLTCWSVFPKSENACLSLHKFLIILSNLSLSCGTGYWNLCKIEPITGLSCKIITICDDNMIMSGDTCMGMIDRVDPNALVSHMEKFFMIPVYQSWEITMPCELRWSGNWEWVCLSIHHLSISLTFSAAHFCASYWWDWFQILEMHSLWNSPDLIWFGYALWNISC